MSKRRRPYGDGSITKRQDGRWEAALRWQTDDGTGVRRRAYAPTRQEALRKLDNLRAERRTGKLPVSQGLTLEAFLTSWLHEKEGQIRPKTWRGYESIIREHIVPAIGNVKLSDLTVDHVKKLSAASSKKLQANTVRNHIMTLRAALNTAVLEGRIDRNPALVVRPPRARRDKETGYRPLTLKEALAVLRVAQRPMLPLTKRDSHEAWLLDGDRFGPLFVLAMTTAMRQGEVLALTWADVDLGSPPSVLVHQSIQRDKDKRLILGETKTDTQRTVQLTRLGVKALERQRMIIQSAKDLAAATGDIWDSPDDLVFPETEGQYRDHPRRLGGVVDSGNLYRRHFRGSLGVLTKAGIPGAEQRRIRFQDLRGTAATLLAHAGVSIKQVSDLLGHASVTTTMKYYQGMDPQHQAAIKALDIIFDQAEAEP